MKTPHKHAELIKAWADGAEIEYRIWGQEEWVPCSPVVGWYPSYEYRIKPEPKPDVIEEMSVYRNLNRRFDNDRRNGERGDFRYVSDLRLTFDGITGKLKSAEIL